MVPWCLCDFRDLGKMIHSEPTTFRYLYGAVYILENTEAKRVKVGMTINDVEGRLKDVNDMWLGIKATCQICGGRRFVDQEGFVPTHVVSGRRCQGSKTFPLEKDSAIAEFHLKELRSSLDELSGVEKNSITVLRFSGSPHSKVDVCPKIAKHKHSGASADSF